MEVTAKRFSTRTGAKRLVFVPSPNCPLLLKPHAQTLPSAFRARQCEPLAAPEMALTSVRKPCPPEPLTCIGSGWALSSVVPCPNVPLKLLPQPQTVPSDFRARLKPLPAEI